MMEVEATLEEHNVFDEILTDEEKSRIPDEILSKIKDACTKKFDEFITAKALFETNRNNIEQKLADFEKKLADTNVDYEECKQKLNLVESFNADLQTRYDEAKQEISKLQDNISRIEKENYELRRQRDMFSDERDNLQAQVDRRNTELERLRTEIESLGNQLQSAIATKCAALQDMEEIKSREITLDFKEKRLEQEKNLMNQQMAALEEELTKLTNELQTTRSEAASRALIKETRLAQCEEELRISNESLAQYRDNQTVLQRRCEELAQKVDEQRNHELSMHASYREEVAAQTKLVVLYKEIADEANKKEEELSSAIKELQELIEKATEEYGILETKYTEESESHVKEMEEKNVKIKELTIELNNANDLLQTLKQEKIDQAIEQIAPTAAVTSRILKKGLSLTQIYTQLVESSNELALTKTENESLKSQISKIMFEMEENAPLLQQKLQDYAAAMENIKTLSSQLDELIKENNRLQENADEAKRKADFHSKQNAKLKTDMADLARQVCFLLKEIQETRTGCMIPDNNYSIMDTEEISSSQVISKRLVTFRDIEELQEKNQQLLSVVRTLSSKKEEVERMSEDLKTGALNEQLGRYKDQIANLQAEQKRHEQMFESLIKQRDMYKNMVTKNADKQNNSQMEEDASMDESTHSKSNTSVTQEDKKYKERIRDLEKKLADSEIRLKQLTDEFETYKKEKDAHAKMLNEEIERLRKEAEGSSVRCCKLKAQLDTVNERFHLLQANVASYKSQIKTLEEKCSNYSTTIGKHEHSLTILHTDLMNTKSQASRAEVQLESLKQAHQMLQASEARLLKEREVLHRERQTQSLIKVDVESIKASLERVQSENQFRAEQRLDDANRECAALRRRLQEEQDRFREITMKLEKQTNAAQERLLEEKKIAEQAQADLNSMRDLEAQHTKRIEELVEKLKVAQTNLITKPISGDENTAKKLKELETELANSQAEIYSLTSQLKSTQNQSQQYCDIAEGSEAQMRELTIQYNKMKEEMEASLQQSQSQVAMLQKKIKDLEEEVTRAYSGHQESGSELRERLSAAESKLEELDELKGEMEILKSDLKTSSEALAEAEDKYAKQMILHSADIQTLAKLREESRAVSKQIEKLVQERDAAIAALNMEKSQIQEREAHYQKDFEESQKRLNDLNQQNSLLHDQIQVLSDRIAVMHSQQTKISDREAMDTSVESMNRSFTEDESKSAEQLLQVIKLLRREKDLALAKFDILKAENLRLKSQVEVYEKRLKDAEEQLKSKRQEIEIDVVAAGKHKELMRKVETLNAITDSNRALREERDALSQKVKELTEKTRSLTVDMGPLREKATSLESKVELLTQENSSLKAEATRWRQRANTLIERANKASPEDWRRLQTERENLSKLLTSEREEHVKQSEELAAIKTEKAKLEEHVTQLQRQLQSQAEQIVKLTEDSKKLSQELTEALTDASSKGRELAELKKKLDDTETVLTDARSKELQIKKIAKKYKTQYEELVKSSEEDKVKFEELKAASSTNESAQLSQEREDELKEEGRAELRQQILDLTNKLNEMIRSIAVMQSESDNLKKEIDILNKTNQEKEERAKQVIKNARMKILSLTEIRNNCEKEIADLKVKIETSCGESSSNLAEAEARLTALKSQMEGRIARLEHEKSEILSEKEALSQRVAQLQRQLTGISGVSATTEPPTANIKPMNARTETPLASIRPMSVVVQSRTAAVIPTTAPVPVHVAPQQQQQQAVHTTETSSPTSSHTDYQPASTSSSSQTVGGNLRQLMVQPQLSESAESTQREEMESSESGQQQTCQPQQCQQTQQTQQQTSQQQQQPQTVALVSPRVEQHQQQAIASDQQQTVPSSSTQSVSTSQTSTSHKRPRAEDSMEMGRQEQISSPKTKRIRSQEMAPIAGSASEVEYQVPTSSQRDQDEEGDDGCVVVDCDEGEGGNQQAQEEEFDNDPYEEEMEEEDCIQYRVIEIDNNEVEFVSIDDAASLVEVVPRQGSNQQQQSEISSAGTTSEPPTSFTSRSSRGIAPMPRQQPLVLQPQGYEDGGDDCIVPSTPTLFTPRRDGFGEAVSSPQVPQGRFTFGEPTTPATASSTPSMMTPTGTATRTMFATSAPGTQGVQEGMDDTRMDLTQLEDGGTGRSVPTTPIQVSPAADIPPSTSTAGQSEEETVKSASAEAPNLDKEESSVPSISVTTEEQENASAEDVLDTENVMNSEDTVTTDSEKQTEEQGATGSGATDEDNVDTGGETTEEAESEVTEDENKEENREAEASPSSNTRQRTVATAVSTAAAAPSPAVPRGVTTRNAGRSPLRGARGSRPTPIVWDSQSSTRGATMSRGARGTPSEGPRGRGSRGRRIRSKYTYNF